MLTSYIQKRSRHYNISEMAIVFSVLAVGAIFPIVGFGAVFLYSFGASKDFAVIASLFLWLGFVVWLWVSFVITGRESPNERVSTGDLTTMQIVCTIIIGLYALFAAPEERHNWQLLGNIFEWVIIGFHVVYFTLAWGMRAKVPLHIYIIFVLILGAVLWTGR